MKKQFCSLLLWLLFTGSALATGTQDLPVRVVGLFTSGVGYFQHGGSVSANNPVELTFRNSQINDLLKSLVVEDLNGSIPDPIIYPSQDPQERLLKRFHVNLSGNPTLANILRQMRGTQVQLQYEGELLRGTLLGVEQRPLAIGKKATQDWVLNLATENGLQVIAIKHMGLLRLEDEELREELKKALETLNQTRSNDRKSISLTFPGQETHQVRVGYVIETPVWKNSYRLIFAEEGQTARLQGWAIIENQSNHDWNGVRLFLVSGQPLSFIQNLYQPHYITRPIVENEHHPGIAPPQYQGGIQPSKIEMAKAPRKMHMQRSMAMSPAAGETMDMDEMMAGINAPQSDWEQQSLQPAGVSVAAEKLGPLFQYMVDGVDLPQQRGAMIPIIADSVAVEKVSIYNHKTLVTYPLQGVLLKNTTGKHLPAGPVTLFNGGFYGGDARLEDLPAGQERLLSYAVDQETQVVGPSKRMESQITSGKIVGGVLTLQHKQLAHQTYLLENQSSEVKTLIVEHPVRHGWTLVNTANLMESTTSWHRFRLGIPSGEQISLTITEEQIHDQRLVLLHSNSSGLFAHVRGTSLSPALRQALEKAAILKQAMETSQQELKENRQQVQNLSKEQKRIHANLKVSNTNSNFHNRMIGKLDKLENNIETLQNSTITLRTELKNRRKQLEAYLLNLRIE